MRSWPRNWTDSHEIEKFSTKSKSFSRNWRVCHKIEKLATKLKRFPRNWKVFDKIEKLFTKLTTLSQNWKSFSQNRGSVHENETFTTKLTAKPYEINLVAYKSGRNVYKIQFCAQVSSISCTKWTKSTKYRWRYTWRPIPQTACCQATCHPWCHAKSRTLSDAFGQPIQIAIYIQ